MATATEGFKRGTQIFATSPGDDDGVELAKQWAREKGLTSRDVSIRKYPFSIAVEVK